MTRDGIRGGQGRSGHEIRKLAISLIWLLLAAVIIAGITLIVGLE